MEGFPTAQWQRWLEAVQEGLVRLAWAEVDEEPRARAPAASWDALWDALLAGPLAAPLEAAGLPPEVLAEVELQRVERVGAGPPGGALERDAQGVSRARALLHARRPDAWWRLASWRAARAAGRAPRGLRRALYGEPLRRAEPGAIEAMRLAADSDEGSAWRVEVAPAAAPGSRVLLVVSPGLAGGAVWELGLTGPGPVEVVAWHPGEPEEWRLVLDRSKPTALRHGEAPVVEAPRLLCWAIAPG